MSFKTQFMSDIFSFYRTMATVLMIYTYIINTMNFNNFTIKAQEAVQKASEIATGNQQQAIENAHLLKGLLLVDENVITYLLKKLNVNLNRLNETLDRADRLFPKGKRQQCLFIIRCKFGFAKSAVVFKGI